MAAHIALRKLAWPYQSLFISRFSSTPIGKRTLIFVPFPPATDLYAATTLSTNHLGDIYQYLNVVFRKPGNI